jgi:hypothetical protein
MRADDFEDGFHGGLFRLDQGSGFATESRATRGVLVVLEYGTAPRELQAAASSALMILGAIDANGMTTSGSPSPVSGCRRMIRYLRENIGTVRLAFPVAFHLPNSGKLRWPGHFQRDRQLGTKGCLPRRQFRYAREDFSE